MSSAVNVVDGCQSVSPTHVSHGEEKADCMLRTIVFYFLKFPLLQCLAQCFDIPVLNETTDGEFIVAGTFETDIWIQFILTALCTS